MCQNQGNKFSSFSILEPIIRVDSGKSLKIAKELGGLDKVKRINYIYFRNFETNKPTGKGKEK